MADLITKNGWGESLEAKTTTAKKKRARTEKGHYQKDDPNTLENEAYE